MKNSGLFLLAVFFLSSWSPAAMAGREGNGGNVSGLEVAALKNKVLNDLTAMHAVMPFSSIDLTKLRSISKLVRFVMSDKPLSVNFENVDQECLAINDSSTHLISIEESRWSAIADLGLRQAILLHELLGLIGAEQTGDYRYSSVYLNMIENQPSSDLLQKTLFPNVFSMEEVLNKLTARTWSTNAVSVVITPIVVFGSTFLGSLTNSQDEIKSNAMAICQFVGYQKVAISNSNYSSREAGTLVFMYTPASGDYPKQLSYENTRQTQSISSGYGVFNLSEMQTPLQGDSYVAYFTRVICTQ
jgi:hypothetical protein